MDEHDPIKEMYYLDVASPGAERPIKKQDYQRQSNSLSLCHFMHLSKIIKNG